MITQYMTGFAKRGLPHTSNNITLKDCNLSLKALTNHRLLTHVDLHYHPNFKTVAVFNLKLRFAKVGKLDVCGRSLFTNSVTYHGVTITFLGCTLFSGVMTTLYFGVVKSGSCITSGAMIASYDSEKYYIINCYVC